MTESVGRFFELLKHADDPKLSAAFNKTLTTEENAIEICDLMYSGKATPVQVSELRRIVPTMPYTGTMDAQAFYAEAFIEGQIARRNGVTAELTSFLNNFGR